MSTAARVPETWELTGDDARKALASVGRVRLLRDSFQRLRAADGFSHARSLAFVTSLVLVQGLIVVVGLASAFGSWSFARVIVETIQTAAPGPASDVLTDAVAQAKNVGNNHRYTPLLVGLVGMLVTATTAFGQLERGFNRIYGIEKDRPTAQKYGRAFISAITAGTVLAGAFMLLAFGRELDAKGDGIVSSVWKVVLWPIGIALAGVALAAILHFAPARRQPGGAWLAFAAAICLLCWSVVTLVLGAVFSLSSSFGQVYGALAGLVALQLWTLLSAIAIFYGAAVAAQLEAVRAGAGAPVTTREPMPGRQATPSGTPA